LFYVQFGHRLELTIRSFFKYQFNHNCTLQLRALITRLAFNRGASTNLPLVQAFSTVEGH